MSRTFTFIIGIAVLIASLIGCDPVPGRDLSESEKRADMEWLFTKFDHNYAPLEYKIEKYGFDYEQMKAEYMQRALATRSNEEFYQVALEFVAQFKDAHTSARLTPSNLPGRTQVAYLGFSGVRMGEALLVRELLPTIKPNSAYPIRPMDLITKINGMPLRQYILENMVRLKDLGSEESNVTAHMNGIFNRTSLTHELPAEADVTLTVIREGKELEVTMPWIVRDLFDFNIDQNTAKAFAKGSLENLVIGDNGQNFALTFVDVEGQPVKFNSVRQFLRQLNRSARFFDTFNMQPNIMGWTAATPEKKEKKKMSAMEKLAQTRQLPEFFAPVQQATVYPAYIAGIDVQDDNGVPTGRKKTVGYIRIDTFSPSAKEDAVIEELKATLKVFESQGVEDIVIDLLNNGGGSLSLVLRVAQLFSNQKIDTFGMQFGLNENWMSDVQASSMKADNDAEREIYRRLYEDMLRQRDAGQRISDTYPIETLMPFKLQPNTELRSPFNIVLLTNEMCASAADMFSAMMKNNNLAVLMGKATMGAGGNVVQHWKSPNASFTLNQTESLLVNPDGSFLENNGVTPHIEVETSLFVVDKYKTLIDAAMQLAVKVSAEEKVAEAKAKEKANAKSKSTVRKAVSSALKSKSDCDKLVSE